MILIIDHKDSFVHNLARYCTLVGADTKVIRHDAIIIEEIKALKPEGIILSPGPKTPNDVQNSIQIVQDFGAGTPILGVCLGHQIIAETYGGKTIRSPQPVHGQASAIRHNEENLFQNIPNPMTVGRYHSLIIDLKNETPLNITAHTDDDHQTIMAIQHQTHPVYGVQFHPESILTDKGLKIISNFHTIIKNHKHNR